MYGKQEQLEVSDDATENIAFACLMNIFREDSMGRIAMKDPLILALGKQLSLKFGGNREQFNYVKGKMRQLTRLLQCLRRTSDENCHAAMSDFVHRSHFRMVIKAAQECAGISNGREYRTSSYALKSGGLVRKCQN